MALSEATRNRMIWGYLRLFLGTAQMVLAAGAAASLLTRGLHWLTLSLVAAACVATIASRLIYSGRPDPGVHRTLERGPRLS